MKITKIKIKNLFGIKECELDGSSVELTGTNGAGKTSILDAIRYALTNDSERDLIIRDGEEGGEILIETDTGLTINRMKREGQVDYKSIKEGRNTVSSPESFLRSLFSDLQIDPVAFIGMPKKEQNRIILDLIDFSWDLNWIKDKFGEIPSGVNYEQNILQVLSDIQAENGDYFKHRQDLNRDIKNKRAFIKEIAASLPPKYDAEKWESFDISAAYKQLTEIQHSNSVIQRAKAFKDSYEGKLRGLEADKELKLSAAEKKIASEREGLTQDITRMKEQIKAAEEILLRLDDKLKAEKALIESNHETAVIKLEQDMGTAGEFIDREIIDTAELQAEIDTAEAMRAHLNEYNRMKTLEVEAEKLQEESNELTRKIELARSLPGEILATATIPVEGLTVENGVPLIHGMPVSNLSEGEKLDLCVDVAISKPAGLQIILIDGIEKLSETNRKRLYKKCKDKGVQFIATRTTDDPDLRVVNL